MILHSEFAQYLDQQVRIGALTRSTVLIILQMASDGVLPESAHESIINLCTPIRKGTRFVMNESNYESPRLNRLGLKDSSNTTSAAISGGFVFGHTSLVNLNGVKPELVQMAKLASQVTTQDFAITDGVRTIEEQRANVKKGVSKTMHSMHLPQADGFSWAVDATPWVNGKLSWDWQHIYAIVAAMDSAATSLGFADHIRWGGAWDRRLSDFGGSGDAYKLACQEYQQRHAGQDFIDGPHFEWVA